MTLRGRTFLDIRRGSGLVFLCAHRCASRVISFDVDLDSVQALRFLHQWAGSLGNWQILQGLILDAESSKAWSALMSCIRGEYFTTG